MPTPRLTTPIISPEIPHPYSFFENTSHLLQQVDGIMAPAGATTEPIASKGSYHEEQNTPVRDTHTPVSVEDTQTTEDGRGILSHAGLVSPELSHSTIDESIRRQDSHIGHNNNVYNGLLRPLPETRYRPNSSSTYLKPGARFTGIQRSEKQQYEVVVDVQHVDMAESFMCGYLRIHALTDEHPTLTTYFEGEMIGSKHSFVTKHPEWGATEKVDLQHWERFSPWKPLRKEFKRGGNFQINNWSQNENIWMRWKEYFLVPDHTVRDLTGASFDGFYYICFNQVSGSITGIYYHLRCEKGQKLDLKPANDGGFDLGFEFR